MDISCKATTKGGVPCSAQPVRPSGFCFWHDPELEHERQANRRRGGQARSNLARARRRYEKEQLTLAEVNGLLAVTIKGVISGQIEPGVGSATAALARAIKDMTLAAELEQRLQALEAQAAHREGRSA